MPGLNQLKKFNNDILSLGDELTIRASRGEKPVRVPIPKTVEDKDDTEEFVLGMPEVAAPIEDTSVDDDLSDITGIGGSSSGKKDSEQEAPSFEAPDLSSIMTPVFADNSSSNADMPDLSQFMDAPEEEVVEEEVVEEEVSVADMKLEDLLSGEGFDGTEGTGEEKQEVNTELESDFYTIDEPETVKEEPAPIQKSVDIPETTNREQGGALPIDELLNASPSQDFSSTGDALPLDDISSLGESDAQAEMPSFDEPVPTQEMPSFDEPVPTQEMPSFDEPEPESISSLEEPAADNIPSLDDSSLSDTSSVGGDFGGNELTSLDDISSMADFELPDEELNFQGNTSTETSDFEDTPIPGDAIETFDTETPLDTNESADFSDTSDSGSSDLDTTSDLSSMSDLGEMPDLQSSSDLGEMPDLGDMSDLSDMPDIGDTEPSGTEFSTEAEALANMGELSDMASDSNIPEYEYDTDEDNPDDSFNPEGEEEGPVEVFDTTGMDDDIDFGIKETDSQLNGDFDMGNADDFAMEGSDFEIPGFSDVDTVKEVTAKKQAPKNTTQDKKPSAPKAKEKEENLPPNTLSNEQYKRFLSNLNEYPLNVRLAFENLIVQDEFTDDAEFEIIEKILNKAPARQVASLLEKMLDTSIPVPRDFEHRTAEEYEAYKKSLSYQLRNRIIPFALLGILLLFVGWGLFNFGKYCIYIPIKASNLYKEGYTLLMADEYPQSEEKFNEAASTKMKKNWFFKFARGYREKKQYQRSERIYNYTLKYFNHDKQAGLELADMHLNDLANYERAEEVVRREILDYHINDPDGILMLGDVFLEWGTEKDPEKFELAFEQYILLEQLYEPNDLYDSRLMRYFIRTNQLKQVLAYKQKFEPREKSLSGDDWTELSGFLLEKLYGELSPSEEYLRNQIEDLRELLQRSVIMSPENPNAWYNLGKYYVQMNESSKIQPSLESAIKAFNEAPHLKTREIFKYIDSYRLLGENYVASQNYLQAQEAYTQGITLFTKEKENAGFEGNALVGNMYSDLGDINYFAAADYSSAQINYEQAIDLGYDNSKIRYRLGYIHYQNKDYLKALGSFVKSGEAVEKKRNLLLALGNTLALRNDDYAAEGYYEQLVSILNEEIMQKNASLFPQANMKENELVTDYLYATNNYGVILYRLAKRTGDSSRNAQAIVQMQESIKAWDTLTRNTQTLVRLSGSNLAEENVKYITHPISEFEPSIYVDIPKTLTDEEKL